MHRSQRRQRVGTHSALAAGIVLAALGGTWGCGNDSPRLPDQVADGRSAEPAARPVQTVTPPADDCGWLPAAEVERVVGPLAGPPKVTADGCVYPLMKDSATLAREQQARVVQAKFDSLQKKLEATFGPAAISEQEAERFDGALRQEPAVILDVVENVDINTERATGAVVGRFVKEALGNAAGGPADGGSEASPPPPVEDGWDRSGSGYAPFRTGHLGVLVRSEGGQVSHEQKARLAALVRDRIPDLPFASARGTTGLGTTGDRDPCGLLAASEAETVLGKLVVPPYRSQEDTPLAEAGGTSCAYLTAGHHALVLSPTWEYGGTVVDAIRGVGGLMSGVVPELRDEAADTLDGPWDEAGSDLTGGLYFLKGERVLVVHHVASSTDHDGAVRLARIAMERLAAAPGGQRAAAERDTRRGPCPAPADLGAAGGFELTFTQVMGASGGWMTCMYELTGRYRGTFLTLAVQPASHADRIFAEVQRTAKVLKGAEAEADRIALGDGGWAYGSGNRSEAAALVRGRLYTAEIQHGGLSGIGDQKDAMVRVLEAASR